MVSADISRFLCGQHLRAPRLCDSLTVDFWWGKTSTLSVFVWTIRGFSVTSLSVFKCEVRSSLFWKSRLTGGSPRDLRWCRSFSPESWPLTWTACAVGSGRWSGSVSVGSAVGGDSLTCHQGSSSSKVEVVVRQGPSFCAGSGASQGGCCSLSYHRSAWKKLMLAAISDCCWWQLRSRRWMNLCCQLWWGWLLGLTR